MKCAAPGCFGFSREHLLAQSRRRAPGAGSRLIGRTHRAKQRQRIPRRHFVIVGPRRVHRRQRFGVGVVARELVARRVIQHVDGAEERLLLRQLRLRQPRLRASARSSRGSPGRPSCPAAPTADGCGSSPRPSTPSRTTGSIFCARWNATAASSNWKLCRLFTPSRNAACAAGAPEVGNVMVPSSCLCAGRGRHARSTPSSPTRASDGPAGQRE